MLDSHRYTVDEWEERVGESVRQARLGAGMGQATLADHADVSLKTIGNLEQGRGSSLATLIRVARALGRADWLEGLAPPTPTVDPMALLQQQTTEPRRRAPAGS